MIAVFLIFLPVVVLTIWLTIASWKRKDLSTVVCVPLFIMALIYQFSILYVQWHNAQEHESLIAIEHWVSDSIPIIVYIFLCTKCNRKWIATSTFVLLAMTLLNLPSGATLYIGDEWGTPAPQDERLYIYVHGESVFRIKLWQLCMAFQFIWIMVRTLFFYHKIKQKHLHFSNKTKTLANSIGTALIAGFLSLLYPDKLWFSSEIPLFTTLILISAGLCTSIYLLAKGYALTPILDSNEEAAIFTTNENEEETWNKIKQIIEEEKLYLDHNLNLAQVAQLAGTNRTYVTNAINKKAGTNLKGYINGLRTDYATELMATHPEKKLEEIAELCGFSSAPTFTKVYKKLTGITPKEGKKRRMEEIKAKNRK